VGAAVIAAVGETPEEAERAVQSAAAPGLAPGYPFAAHTDELGMHDDPRVGIAIVTGLFRSEADAKAAIARGEITGDVVSLGSIDEHAPIRQVVAIDGEPRPAYASPSATSPSCTLAAHRIFVVSSDVVWGPPVLGDSHTGSSEAATAPPRLEVRCNGRSAFVDLTHTRYLTTVMATTETGGAHVLQSVQVACDTATILRWDFERGRRIGTGAIVQDCP
jgi:hypothetical protein